MENKAQENIWWAFQARIRFHRAYCQGDNHHCPSCPRHGGQIFKTLMRQNRLARGLPR